MKFSTGVQPDPRKNQNYFGLDQGKQEDEGISFHFLFSPGEIYSSPWWSCKYIFNVLLLRQLRLTVFFNYYFYMLCSGVPLGGHGSFSLKYINLLGFCLNYFTYVLSLYSFHLRYSVN